MKPNKPTLMPRALSDGLVVQELSGEVLVYNLKTDKVSALNDVAAYVWQHCDGTTELQNVVDQSAGRVTVDSTLFALQGLSDAGLLQDHDQFSGLSRREMLLRAGLVVAIPAISTLVAPVAANAASFLGDGSCPPGFADCDGLSTNGCEINLKTDASNCGSCGHICAVGDTCVNGACINIK